MASIHSHQAPSPRLASWAVGLWGLVAVSLGLPLSLVPLYLMVSGEYYFWPYPAIDTHFAPGYSEAKFAQVKIGMSQAEVIQLIGQPLDRYATDTAILWTYSQDGASPIGDLAWLSRVVSFDPTGRVIEIEKTVYYD